VPRLSGANSAKILGHGASFVERLGKYEIISEIGRGAMGAVYKARDPLIGRLVALKTITSGMTAQANSLERFYQEARSAGALQHPNIVTIYELGHENNTPFIAMEFIEGGSLDNLIEQRQVLPLSVKLGYIVRVCEALSYAHRHNVVHRDIKPGNVMVTKEGAVKVVDFGIARLTDMSLTQPNMMIGSRAYMSPQLYKGERADARADIWAVGVTLYELLASQRPFTGDSEAELMFHIMSDNPQALQSLVVDCPEELSRIVGKMLVKKVEERYQSMDEVLRDLEPLWKSAQQATVAGLLADCQQLMAANDMQRAQALLRKALQIDMGNTQAKSLLEKVSSELRRSQLLPKLNEHLERGRTFLRTGKLREARGEVDAALGLDSRHESAKQLFAEVEAAAARVQEAEQKLRLAKQRLAEGALTEAATALGQALDLDSANAQGQELRKQIEEERNRREKRKKLSEVLHQARTLWTALNYEECLKVLSEGLREFPGEPELLKLQEMARHDLEDLKKQRQLGEVRKLLGQQEFAQARKIIDALAKTYPQDSAVNNLQTLVLDGEKEQQRDLRYSKELSDLRTLLSNGKFGEAVNKGDALLREYPEEFELKELVGYARSEVVQQEQRQKEKDREKQIRNFIAQEHFQEAEAAAKRATLEFPKLEVFRKLAEEAGQKRLAQEQRERARQEMQRRIDDLQGMIKQGKISDAIDLAQQTLGTFGPDPNVTQLLQTASSKQAERKKKEDQDRQIAAAQTLADAGNFAGATQVLSQAMATQIFERSDPRVQQQLRTIEQLSNTAKSRPSTEARPRPTPPTPGVVAAGDGKNAETVPRRDAPPPQTGTTSFSATMVLGSQSAGTTAKSSSTPRTDRSEKDDRLAKESFPAARTPAPGKTVSAKASANVAAGKQGDNLFAATPVSTEQSAPRAARRPLIPPEVLAQIQGLIKKPAVLAGVGGALVVILIVVLVVGRFKGPGEKEKKIRDQAEQLWTNHQFEQSEQAWRQLEQLHGYYGKEATSQISQIEEKRGIEKRRFDEGERLLKEEKNYAAASQAFEEVIAMNLWLAEEAKGELAAAKALGSTEDIHAQEKLHFDQGEAFFHAGDIEKARKEFQTVVDLKIQDSTIRPQAENYLKKMRQVADTKKLYDTALADIKSENWAQAQQQLQEVVDRKGSMSAEAKQRLNDVAAAQKVQETFRQSLSAGAYKNAKSQLDGMQQWPKTKALLLQELQAAEHQQATNIEGRARSLQASGDLDGLESLRSELRNFSGRVEDASLVKWSSELDKWVENAAQQLKAKQSDKTVFDAAVADFNAAKEKKDSNRLGHEVRDKFQKIAKGSGTYRELAQEYVTKTIPAAMQELTKSIGNGKLVVPAIVCSGGQGRAAAGAANAQSISCAQMDADVSLEWIGTPTVEFPSSANQPGKLPYTLRLIVFVDPSGKVKVEKDGNVDNDFFKKAKDASKNWKTNIPKAGGKPARVSFPLAIIFQK
jgi:eukaryotic-like serine/threonine-protein kinase